MGYGAILTSSRFLRINCCLPWVLINASWRWIAILALSKEALRRIHRWIFSNLTYLPIHFSNMLHSRSWVRRGGEILGALSFTAALNIFSTFLTYSILSLIHCSPFIANLSLISIFFTVYMCDVWSSSSLILVIEISLLMELSFL